MIIIDGVIFYSIEQLIDDKINSLKLIKFLIDKKKIIFFALEELKITKNENYKVLKDILFIKKNSMKQNIIKNKSFFAINK